MKFNTWRPSFIWALFILIICGIPGKQLPQQDFWQWIKFDKVIHIGVFSLQGLLLIFYLSKDNMHPFFRYHFLTWSVIFTTVFGIIIEILQETIFIDRTGDWKDVVADFLGALVAIFIYKRWQQKLLTLFRLK